MKLTLTICLNMGGEGLFNFTPPVRNRRNIFQSNVCNLFFPGISLLEAYEHQSPDLKLLRVENKPCTPGRSCSKPD